MFAFFLIAFFLTQIRWIENKAQMFVAPGTQPLFVVYQSNDTKCVTCYMLRNCHAPASDFIGQTVCSLEIYCNDICTVNYVASTAESLPIQFSPPHWFLRFQKFNTTESTEINRVR